KAEREAGMAQALSENLQAAITHYQGVAEQWKREALAEQVKVEILRDRVAKAEREAGMAQALSENLQAQNAAILSSTSWRVTWPLRAIVRRLRPG
ncbi:MAG TPA: hypothetical protein PLH31_02330, partial [Caulobacter sp.]|nr:hypothetical protein [Caulobacter sp.]